MISRLNDLHMHIRVYKRSIIMKYALRLQIRILNHLKGDTFLRKCKE